MLRGGLIYQPLPLQRHYDWHLFHLWFHPSNFWNDTEQQFATFEQFAAHAADLVERGELVIKPMAAFA